MVFDHAGMTPNPARDRVIVKLPREDPEEPNPPSAEQVEAVYWTLPSRHQLALLFLDWSCARVSAIDKTLVGDYDETRRRVRLRAATTKTRQALRIDLPPALADAVEATLPPREDRDPDARLFADSGADAIRTAIAKACKALGIPAWSPHDLRHRRVSLLHLRGVPWARIGEQVGQRNLAASVRTLEAAAGAGSRSTSLAREIAREPVGCQNSVPPANRHVARDGPELAPQRAPE